jgi:hypothetical protein
MLGLRLGPRLCAQWGGLRVAISEDARKSVVFFGKLVPSGEIEYGGTGFLVSHEDEGHTFRYLVTCRHVAQHLDVDFVLRLNTVKGDAEECPVENADWQYHPDETVDVAVANIGLNALHFDHLTLPISKSAVRDTLSCGQRIHIIGLFRLHFGSKRNVPIVHTGHIAALADNKERVPIKDDATGKTILSEAYLVEAQTLDGLSGSPVFVHEYIAWQAHDTESKSDVTIAAFGTMKLLGVYQGSWDALPGDILAADRNLGGKVRVPVGMGLVVPIERVQELIKENPTLKQNRREIKQANTEKKAAKTGAGFLTNQASDENPDHQEDFNRLVSAASKRKPKGDRT